MKLYCYLNATWLMDDIQLLPMQTEAVATQYLLHVGLWNRG
jgi:hypothetical protein